jgi:hypothetical protein
VSVLQKRQVSIVTTGPGTSGIKVNNEGKGAEKEGCFLNDY